MRTRISGYGILYSSTGMILNSFTINNHEFTIVYAYQDYLM